MAFDSVLNLPAHPLLVHIPVAGIPLASIGAVGAQLANMSGESLQESRRLRAIGDHGDYEELEEQVKPEETHPDPMHRGTNREAVLRCLLRCQAPEGFPQVIAVQVHSSRLE